MKVIFAEDVGTALAHGLHHLASHGTLEESRNGAVLVSPTPVTTVYRDPRRRVLFGKLRDANPFFHLYEAMWMLAGRKDAESVSRYAAHISTFASDAGVLWGAYGWRWRSFFGGDQLREIIHLLSKDKSSRRAVLAMWTPDGDLWPKTVPAKNDASAEEGVYASKDVPCNTHVYFRVNDNKLDMTVCNRSNDIVWGAYGANVVHMSMLQEFMAGAIGVGLGTYYQVSNNFHAYVDRPDVQRLITRGPSPGIKWSVRWSGEQPTESVHHIPMQVSPFYAGEYLDAIERFVDAPTLDHAGAPSFISQMCVPMMRAHAEYKQGGTLRSCFAELESTPKYSASGKFTGHVDWVAAGMDWLATRFENRALKEKAGV